MLYSHKNIIKIRSTYGELAEPGLMHLTWNQTWGQTHRGFESLTLRHIQETRTLLRVFLCTKQNTTLSEGEKPRCSTKRHDSRFAQPKAARRESAMEGASESLTLRHIQEAYSCGLFLLFYPA